MHRTAGILRLFKRNLRPKFYPLYRQGLHPPAACNANRWASEMDVPYKLYKGDCLEVMPQLEAGSVDAIITDLPYGTTACEWDSIIPLAPMWEQVKRVLKKRGVFVTTASQPFTSALVMSNPEWFKYEWIWDKKSKGNFLQANFQPLKVHENVLVFSEYPATYVKGKDTAIYYAQKVFGYFSKSRKTVYPNSWRDRTKSNYVVESKSSDSRYPTTILEFSNASHVGKEHPTQKNSELYEYLIKTYTNFGETVLDITMGSGTTIIAAMKTGRKSIGIERDPKYFAIAEKRIRKAAQQPALLHEAQQSVHLTASGAGGRGQIPLQGFDQADDPSATHGGR